MTTTLRRALLAATVLAAAPIAVTRAQRVAPVLDVGASTVRYGDTQSISATTVSPALRVESASATLLVAGTFSQITSGGSSAQGVVSASRFAPIGERVHGELSATAGGSTHHDRTRTGQLLMLGRAHLMGQARGAWLGAGVGSAWDGVSAHRITTVDAGAWVSSGTATVLAAVTPTSVSDRALPSLHYTDLALAARWTDGGTELGASLGARAGDDVPAAGDGSSVWASLSATFWLAGPVALTTSVGTYPIDYTQGYPGGRFASLAVRLARRPARKATSTADASRASAAGAASPTSVVATFSVGPSADRRHRTIAVRAPAVTSVEVTGDFTGWQPVRMIRQRDGRWTATLPIPAGAHEIALRIDGGSWIAPPGLTTIRDEFGAMTGVLVIRE